jgi:hypothetical protein
VSNEHDPDFPGNPPPAFDPAIIDRMVNERIAATMSPLFQTADAVSRFGADAVEINGYLAGNPADLQAFQKITQADPEAAAKYARQAWETSKRSAALDQADAGDREVRHARSEALADAGLVGSASRGGGRGVAPTSVDAHEDKLEKLLERAQTTGDATPYMREKFFGGPDPLIEMWLPGEAPPAGMMRRKYKNLEEIV